MLVLFDERQDSPTAGRTQECALSDESPTLVQIPTGHLAWLSGARPGAALCSSI